MMNVQYAKEIPEIGQYDVIVCGGGAAGYCAAVQAARAGAKTALVEQYGMMGGVMTVGGNPEIGLFNAGSLPIIRGIGWETVTRLAGRGWAVIPEFLDGVRHSRQNVSVNGPMMAECMDEIALESGVTLFFHHTLCDAVTENGHVRGIVVTTKSGLQLLSGECFIDATGDGDLSALAGAAFHLGGDDGETDLQPGTFRMYLSGYDPDKINRDEAQVSFRHAVDSGVLSCHDIWTSCAGTMFDAGGDNLNHIAVNGADSRSRSDAAVEGRRSMARMVEWARANVKGAEQLRPDACAVETAVRESRRVVCDYTVTVEDYVNAVEFDDGICYSYYPIDLHRLDGSDSLKNIAIREGGVPQIPLRAMLAAGLDNLLVAGRCISGDRLAQSAYRVKASCMAMGQAAGAAAALSVTQNRALREVPAADLKALLRDNDAIVPDKA